MLANCPFCGHTLLLVAMYRRGARRICDRCEEFSEFDGSKLVARRGLDSPARPLVKTGRSDVAVEAPPRGVRAG